MTDNQHCEQRIIRRLLTARTTARAGETGPVAPILLRALGLLVAVTAVAVLAPELVVVAGGAALVFSLGVA